MLKEMFKKKINEKSFDEVHVAHRFHWTVVIFQQIQRAGWCICPILERVSICRLAVQIRFLHSKTCTKSRLLIFFLSSFLSLTSFCLIILGVESYCCIWSHRMTHTHTHSVGHLWTRDRPVAEISVKHNIHKRQIPMAPAGFEPTVPASQRL